MYCIAVCIVYSQKLVLRLGLYGVFVDYMVISLNMYLRLSYFSPEIL